jgi:hypothetical protein
MIAAAEESKESHWQLIGQWDNDLLTGTDEGYTNGARIALARELSPDSAEHDFLQNALRRLTGAGGGYAFDNLRFPASGQRRFQYGVGLTQLMFTPDDPDALIPPPGQRPYAGWLGLEVSLQASAGDSASTASLSIGTTGRLSYAEDIQKWIHQNVSDSPTFKGWDSQAPGELTINLHFDHKQRLHLFDQTRNWPVAVDGLYEWGAALGNFRTDAYLGARLRAGHNLPARHATPRLQLGSFTETLFEPDRAPRSDFSLYGFAGVRGYAVLQDISLDGPIFRDWEESVDSEPWVGELSFGLAIRYQQMELSLSHTVRTHEFEHQDNRSRFGSLSIRLQTQF